MATITCKIEPYIVNGWLIVRLPKEASAELSSRGQAMVEGTINGVQFQTPLEPDGTWSHWFRVDAKLAKTADVQPGKTATLELTPLTIWPEPEVPAILTNAVKASPKAQAVWDSGTPMAHWEWIRWIRSSDKQETRAHRIEVAISKLESGERRPCCWNRNLSTEPSVSKSGVLIDPRAT